MANIRYVLSVGGARGSYQAGAIAQLHSIGLNGTHYYGHSVGSLNGALAATGGYHKLYDIWSTIKNKDVYNNKFNVARSIIALMKKESVIDTRPLENLIFNNLNDKTFIAGFNTGYVDLQTGELIRKSYNAGTSAIDCSEAVYNSSAIPFAFKLKNYKADGGIIEPIPLSPAISDSEPDDIFVIISCHPINSLEKLQLQNSQIDQLIRTFDIMQHTLVEKSVEPFMLINRLANGGSLVDPQTGRTYYSFRSIIISPENSLDWGMLDFDSSRRGLLLGIEDAKIAYNNINFNVK